MGTQYAGLHPSGGGGVNTVGNRILKESKFGTGHVLEGYHPKIRVGLNAMEREILNLC